MDATKTAKMRVLLKAAVPVIGCAQAIVEKIDRITQSEAYVKFMLLAKEHGVAFESADMELADLKIAIEEFMSKLNAKI